MKEVRILLPLNLFIQFRWKDYVQCVFGPWKLCSFESITSPVLCRCGLFCPLAAQILSQCSEAWEQTFKTWFCFYLTQKGFILYGGRALEIWTGFSGTGIGVGCAPWVKKGHCERGWEETTLWVRLSSWNCLNQSECYPGNMSSVHTLRNEHSHTSNEQKWRNCLAF